MNKSKCHVKIIDGSFDYSTCDCERCKWISKTSDKVVDTITDQSSDMQMDSEIYNKISDRNSKLMGKSLPPIDQSPNDILMNLAIQKEKDTLHPPLADQSSEDRVIEILGDRIKMRSRTFEKGYIFMPLEEVLQEIRQALSDYRREVIEEIIDTVPSYFGRIVRFPESKSTIEDEIHDRVCKKNEDEIAKWKQSLLLRNNRLT